MFAEISGVPWKDVGLRPRDFVNRIGRLDPSRRPETRVRERSLRNHSVFDPPGTSLVAALLILIPLGWSLEAHAGSSLVAQEQERTTPWNPAPSSGRDGLRETAETTGATGTVEGIVTLGGTPLPEPTTVLNSTDPETCGREHSLLDLVVSSDNRGVRYVIASVTGVPGERVPDSEPKRFVIDNRECQFEPHVGVATVGDTVVAKNSDPLLHTVHYYGPLRSNISLAQEGMTASRMVRVAGLVTVLCDVHGWMKAFIRVDPHAFHDVTDARGGFRIEDVPTGHYTLELWHERLGTREIPIEVQEGEVSTVEAEYPPPEG